MAQKDHAKQVEVKSECSKTIHPLGKMIANHYKVSCPKNMRKPINDIIHHICDEVSEIIQQLHCPLP